jgi:hypothetical protein
MAVPHSAAGSTVTLAWDDNKDTATTGYVLYSTDVAGQPVFRVDVGMNITAVVDDLTPGMIYLFYVTAYNSSGVESAPSDGVAYTAPYSENPPLYENPPLEAWMVSAQGNLNGDGTPDLIWRNQETGSVGVWLMDGITASSTAVLWPATNPGDSDWVPMTTGDFDGDGKTDVIWRNSASGRVIVWLMRGTTRVSTTTLWPTTNPGDADWIPMAAGDFNSDGKSDLVWRNATTGRVIVWLMNGITRILTPTIWPATNVDDSAWVPLVAGDFNSDGKSDLVWRNAVTGRVVVWLMDGITRTSAPTIWPATNAGDSDWVPRAAGDFNGDGQSDVIWRNTTSGRVIVWYMNGITRIGTAVVLQ